MQQLIYMQQVNAYLQKYSGDIFQLFKNLSVDQQISASEMFTFLKEVFQIGLERCQFFIKGQQFFQNENFSSQMELVIEKYEKNKNPSSKFYFYRVKFQFEEIFEFIRFWVKSNPQLVILIKTPQDMSMKVITQSKQQSIVNTIQSQDKEQFLKKRQMQLESTENQFLQSQKKDIQALLLEYNTEINQCNKILQQTDITPEIRTQKIQSIEVLKRKISEIEQSRKKTIKQSQTPKLSTKSNKKPTINLKVIFQFYAKQIHLTGVKATFGRIEHQSQTINYQKLVHFLREYQLFPNDLKKQKAVYALYIELCSDTRNLNFQGFSKFIQKLSQIIINQGTPQQKKDALIYKMALKNKKKKQEKILSKPFHSPQKQDFRINSEEIKYQFKIHPLNGMLEQEIKNELEIRRQNKEQIKNNLKKEKQLKQKRYLTKLQAIDPFHPMVIDNPLLKGKSVSQRPIANFDNIQQYRDASFDMAKYFGIKDLHKDPIKDLSMSLQSDVIRVKKVQTLQLQKMKSLMNGIIERADAKIQKMRASPFKNIKK